ncbi:unnamed protein product [marine sediment metagenome]|uniref:Uncharacterized protein n=1 Tax=marine sediment metagenome TaxID=412755 RepID=X1M041_9ZZZZ
MEEHKVFAIKLPITLYKDIKAKADSQEMFVSEYIRKVLIAFPGAEETIKKRAEAAEKFVLGLMDQVPALTKKAVKEALGEEVK